MPKVLLRDVVARIKDKVDKDGTNLEYYIGGEHFDYAEVCITKRGVIQGSTIGPAFHMHFMPGDVLLMSRNPHLRKAGVVDFEGICSDVRYVCRTKDESVLLQRYLPFIFQTDHFWEFAERNKKGSTNFFLNWSDFEKYEFDFPSIEEQYKLTELLWSAQDTKMAYQELLRQSDELVKSQFIELFGDPITNEKGWRLSAFADSCIIVTGNTPSRKEPEYYGSDIEWIKSDNISPNSIYLHRAVESLSKKGKLVGRVVPAGSILMTCIAGSLNTIGNVAIADREVAFNQQINAFVPQQYETYFLYYLLVAMRSQLHEATNNALKCILNKGTLEKINAIVPDRSLQIRFSDIAKQIDKSK